MSEADLHALILALADRVVAQAECLAKRAEKAEAPWARIRALEAEAKRLKDAIRKHRDAKADDRCWIDDLSLYSALGKGEDETADNHIGDPEAMLINCRRFIAFRCQPGKWPSYMELEEIIVQMAQLVKTGRLNIASDLMRLAHKAAELMKAKGPIYP